MKEHNSKPYLRYSKAFRNLKFHSCWIEQIHRTVKGLRPQRKNKSKQVRQHRGKVHTQHKQQDCSKCNSSSTLQVAFACKQHRRRYRVRRAHWWVEAYVVCTNEAEVKRKNGQQEVKETVSKQRTENS